jgi:arsenite methyltransferase
MAFVASTVEQQAGSSENGSLDIEHAVRTRYSNAAQAAEGSLCCPVDYDPQYLKCIPEEILERDYGCGDPSRYLHEGETVLDLGSGGGKICYIASQVVGATGRVIGVDCNDEMLTLANKYRQSIGETLGYQNVEFHKGRIQDLALDLDALERFLEANPVSGSNAWLAAESQAETLRQSEPMIANDSIDVIVSNCVLNLVHLSDRQQLFAEMQRVLRRGGRAVISDIVSDETATDEMRNDPHLWSGCLSGAYREDEFLAMFEEAGFYGIEIIARQDEPWAVVEGIEFRSVTVQAFKGKDGPCLDHRQAVIYNGPWKAVIDDDGHKLLRGQRMAVCDKTFQIYSHAPYGEQITALPPSQPVSLEEALPFDCTGLTIRSPQETKGNQAGLTILPDADCCGDDTCC